VLTFIKTVVAEQMTLTGMNTNSISKNDQIDAIWANTKKDSKTAIYQGSLKNLNTLSDEEVLAMFLQLPEEVVVPEVSIEDVASATDITAHLDSKGNQYLTIGLELIEVGHLATSLKFKHGECTVLVTGDLDCYIVNKTTPFEVGTIMQFGYDGFDTFKAPYTDKSLLFANNSIDHPNRGMLNKTVNAIFLPLLMEREVAKMDTKVNNLEIASKNKVSVKVVQQVIKGDLNNKILADHYASQK
jgi:hypothetical protein